MDSPKNLQLLISEFEAPQLTSRSSFAPTDQHFAKSGHEIGNSHSLASVGSGLGVAIFGRSPQEDERRRLARYLSGLAAQLYRLSLRCLNERLDRNNGLALPQVYTMPATESLVEVARGRPADLRHYFVAHDPSRPLRPEYDPSVVLPSDALQVFGDPVGRPSVVPNLAPGTLVMMRPRLAIESLQTHRHMVLLGEPGSGKSAFVRHLAWALAQRELGEKVDNTALRGWDERRHALPILLPLRQLAARLARDGSSDATLYAVLRDELRNFCAEPIDALLDRALVSGTVLLLLDGLDQLPPDDTATMAGRQTTLRVLHAFARRYPWAGVVITCRSRAFDARLRERLGWSIETLAGFTLGQIRHFVPSWFAEMVAKGQLEPAQAARRQERLLSAIADISDPHVGRLAQSPMLLTMLALVVRSQGTLPGDRSQLYERTFHVLLGRREGIFRGEVPTLTGAINFPDQDNDRLRPLLDRLSYAAHTASNEGRGRLTRGALSTALIASFEPARYLGEGDALPRYREAFEQGVELLMPDDSDAFAHLTMQEHCAGRHLLLECPDAIEQVCERCIDDRWREPILLGLGVVQHQCPEQLERILDALIDRGMLGRTKELTRWYRHLIFAAEIGAERGWDALREQNVAVERLQSKLRAGLVAVLGEREHLLSTDERVRAGFLLGDLGDMRYPVAVVDWQRSITQALAGEDGYFCRVEAGEYVIGNALDVGADDLPRQIVAFDAPFWIARFPITNEQWQAWVRAEGEPLWDVQDACVGHPNQPVVGGSWHDVSAFCAWLSDQVGMDVRLPTEQEWEAAARGGDARRYPWGNTWRDACAATGEDQAIRGALGCVPVGCYPAGAASCGASDMSGNVREWTTSIRRMYPGMLRSAVDDRQRVLRGGGYVDDRNHVRCGSRVSLLPDFLNVGSGGFRVVITPRDS